VIAVISLLAVAVLLSGIVLADALRRLALAIDELEFNVLLKHFRSEHAEDDEEDEEVN
jgi:hypothetical protein